VRTPLPTPLQGYIDAVISTVEESYSLPKGSVRSPRRQAKLVRARHAAWLIAKDLLKLSWPKMGGAFDRDHTSVMHGVRKVRAAVKACPLYAQEILKLKVAALERIGEL